MTLAIVTENIIQPWLEKRLHEILSNIDLYVNNKLSRFPIQENLLELESFFSKENFLRNLNEDREVTVIGRVLENEKREGGYQSSLASFKVYINGTHDDDRCY
ncbi:unnamed protein product [Rhizophagus irregularis]|uniref:Uncharacterized protein n=1 Tax=Rhizophagus irregularis TaxID=588596 RepID=A0A915ZM93_9GLOM|nr:unnamed protein product [Rhizophagus irregularis]CAB5211314.1 unnamed protein product [Rhizophagus irregularis]CAB5383207.1 unnamed protein product [Rhizophagus irregularis]